MYSSTIHQTGYSSLGKVLRERLGFSQQPVLYQDLSLPLHNFIRCLVYDDYSSLLIKGKATQEQLQAAWKIIDSKYIDLNYENENVYILELRRSISLLVSHISETEDSIFFLRVRYHEGLVRILKSNGYRDKFESEVPDEYEHILASIEARLGLKKQALESKKKEFNDYIKEHKGDEIKESYFTKWLVRLAKFQGVAVIRSKEISAMEFVMLLKEFTGFVNSKNLVDGEQR